MPRQHAFARLARVAARGADWAAVPAQARLTYLERVIEGIAAAAEAWALEAARSSDGRAGDDAVADEWLAGPWPVARFARTLARAMTHVQPLRASRTFRDRVIARVFPMAGADRVLFPAVAADAWMAEGRAPTRTIGGAPGGGPAVIAAPNRPSAQAPIEALAKLFVEDRVAVVRVGPELAAVAPHFERALAPLVDEGFVAFVSGDAELDAELAREAPVEQMSAPGATPILVVPGPWSAADMRFHAGQLARVVTGRASPDVLATKVLVVARGWLQRATFADELARALGGAGALHVVDFDLTEAEDFLRAALGAAREGAWGNATAVMLAHPYTIERHGLELDATIAALPHRTVCVNAVPAAAWAVAARAWRLEHPHTIVVRGPFRPWPRPPWLVQGAHAIDRARRLLRHERAPTFSTALSALSL